MRAWLAVITPVLLLPMVGVSLPTPFGASPAAAATGDITSISLTEVGTSDLASLGLDNLVKPRGQNTDVAVLGTTAFVGGGSLFHGAQSTAGRICTDYGGVKVVDVSNPATPTLIDTNAGLAGVQQIAVADTKTVAQGPTGNPRRGATVPNVASSVSALHALRHPTANVDVLAIATQRCEQGFFNGARVEFWNVTNRSAPVLMQFFDGTQIVPTAEWGIIEEVNMFTRNNGPGGSPKMYAMLTYPFSVGNAHGATQNGDFRLLDITGLPNNPVIQVSNFPTASMGSNTNNGCRIFSGGRNAKPTPDGTSAIFSNYDGFQPSTAVRERTGLSGNPDAGDPNDDNPNSSAVIKLDLDNFPVFDQNAAGQLRTYTPTPKSWGYPAAEDGGMDAAGIEEGNAADVEPYTGPSGQLLTIVSEDDPDPALTNVSITNPPGIYPDSRGCDTIVGKKLYELTGQQLSGDAVYVGRGCPASHLANDNLPVEDAYLADPTGKIAVIDAGGSAFFACSIGDKVKRAAAAGATGAIFTMGISPLTNNGTVAAQGEGPIPTIPAVGANYRSWNMMAGYIPNRIVSGAGFPGTWVRSSATNVTVRQRALSITGASNTNPITITSTAHLLTTGDKVSIYQVPGNTAANGDWTVTVTGPNTFTIPVAGNGATQNGGVAVPCPPGAGSCAAQRSDVSRFKSVANATDRTAVGEVNPTVVTTSALATAPALPPIGGSSNSTAIAVNPVPCPDGTAAPCPNAAQTFTDGVSTMAPASFTDGVSTNASTTYTSATANFLTTDVGRAISGTNIPVGATIATRVSATTITLSAAATGSGTGLSFTVTRGSTTYTSATAAFTGADVGRAISGTNIPAGVTIAAVVNGTTVTLSAPVTAAGTGLTVVVTRGPQTVGLNGNPVRFANGVYVNLSQAAAPGATSLITSFAGDTDSFYDDIPAGTTGSNAFPVVAGQSYDAGVFLETETYVGGSFTAEVVWRNNTGGVVSTWTLGSQSAVTPRTAYNSVVTAPVGATRATVKFSWTGGASADGTAYADTFTFVPDNLQLNLKDLPGACSNLTAWPPTAGQCGTAQARWGAQKIVDFSQAVPTTVSTYRSPNSLTWPPPDNGIYSPRQARMFGKDVAFTTWMSDGLRVLDVSNPANPVERAAYVPGGAPAADPTPLAGAGISNRRDGGPIVRGPSWPQAHLINAVDIIPTGQGSGYAVLSDINAGLKVVKFEIHRSGTAGLFNSVTPSRILDTRAAPDKTGVCTPSPCSAVAAGSPIEVQVAGQGGIPASGVSAVVMNVSVTSPSANSFLKVWPSDQTEPNSSNLNFVSGQTIPNLVTVKLSPTGTVKIGNATGSTEVIADVAGWYTDDTGVSGTRFTTLTPARLLDTRTPGESGGAAPIGSCNPSCSRIFAGTPLEVQVTGRAGVPSSGVTAVVMNVAVTGPLNSAGFLRVWPSDATEPNASNLNYTAGKTTANLVTVKLSATGTVKMSHNITGNTNVIADVAGWYSTTSATTGARFTPLTPTRILDTRPLPDKTGVCTPSCNAVVAGSPLTVQLAGQGGIPGSGVSAVVMNTAVVPSAAGFLRVWPADATEPNASNINYVSGEIIPNLVAVKTSATGTVKISHNTTGSTEVIADAAGWFNTE